jgi:hypothetical protein
MVTRVMGAEGFRRFQAYHASRRERETYRQTG